MSDEIGLLKEISKKLSQLIFLTKLANLKVIQEAKREIRKDEVCQEILSLADGSLSSSHLKERVMAKTKVSDTTVERRISRLVEKGALVSVRKGKESYYENSGLYD